MLETKASQEILNNFLRPAAHYHVFWNVKLVNSSD